MKNESKEVEAKSSWWCDTCKTKEEMTHPQMMEHLIMAHGLNPKGLKCNKRMLSYMDGDTWYTYAWEVTIGEGEKVIKLHNESISPRDKDDMMRWA